VIKITDSKISLFFDLIKRLLFILEVMVCWKSLLMSLGCLISGGYVLGRDECLWCKACVRASFDSVYI